MKKLFTLISVLVLTFGASAQTQHMYEWKNGSITVRTVTEVDSLTFSLPADAVTFTTGDPSALTENCMTASYSLSTSLTINNSGATTEQGVCYSLEHEEPTIADSKAVYGTMYKGSWKSTLSQLRSGCVYYYRPYLKIADAVFYGPVKSFTALGDYDDIPAHAVNLGLPSGTLWANRNVGADAPEAYGDYFAWGEVTPKTEYNWWTYKLCKGYFDSHIKYCTDSSWGTVDNKTVLDLEDDAAYVNMGAEWRMPTLAEQDELLNNCTWTWTTQNGVNGYKVTGPNGNSIFLPAAGARFSLDIGGVGSHGYYWSGSLSESDSNFARYLYFFKSGKYDWRGNYRYYGQTVRAVVR